MDEEYANELMKVAIARASVALGFKQCEQSVLDSLSDVIQNYIKTLGRHSQEQCEVSDRVYAGIHDVIPVLESTKPRSITWKELRSFAFEDVKNPNLESSSKWCQPFPFEVLDFPVDCPKDSISTVNNSQLYDEKSNSDIKDLYVPSHLPSYPPIHTYKRTSSSSSNKRNLANHISKDDNQEKINRKAQRIANIKSAQHSLTIIEDSIDNIQ